MAAAIGGLAAETGYIVEVMSRDPARAQAQAERIGTRAKTAQFGSVPAGDIVILAVPYSAVLDVVKHYGEALADKLLVDITNPIKSDFSGFLSPPSSSGAQEVAKVAPAGAEVVKAFNTLPSQALAAGSVAGGALDVFIAGDDLEAKVRVSAFVEILGLRPMDAGPLAMAWALEHACLLWLGLMTHSIKHADFSIGISLHG
jgi:predicted dinucleotide-binding enzyme